MATDNSDSLDTGVDNNDPINKNKFWHFLSVGQKKMAIIAGIIVALGIIGKGVWDVNTAITKYKENTVTIDSLKSEVTRLEKKLNDKLDTAVYNARKKYGSVHIITINSIEASFMTDYSFRGVNYKLDKNSTMYYYVGGILYPVYRDVTSGIYYYRDDANTAIVCR